LAAELGIVARERAVERYSLSANIDALLELYRELVPERAAGGAVAAG
jgi:glycosyltransferase involved in cell wall biosynthesis